MAKLHVAVAALAVGSTLIGSTASAQGAPVPAPAPGPARMFPAPNYQLFRNDIGFGAGTVFSQEIYAGNVSVEPKVNVLDNVAVGGRIDVLVGGGGNLGGDGEDVSVKQHVAVATLLKADLFLTRAAVRPWVGLGVGRYAIIGQGADTGDDVQVDQNAGAYFGVAPQVGLELGAFRLSATYNHIVGAQVEVRQSVGGETKKYSQDYATVELGFRFGGRRR